jgi:hypothetical protein
MEAVSSFLAAFLLDHGGLSSTSVCFIVFCFGSGLVMLPLSSYYVVRWGAVDGTDDSESDVDSDLEGLVSAGVELGGLGPRTNL